MDTHLKVDLIAAATGQMNHQWDFWDQYRNGIIQFQCSFLTILNFKGTNNFPSFSPGYLVQVGGKVPETIMLRISHNMGLLVGFSMDLTSFVRINGMLG